MNTCQPDSAAPLESFPSLSTKRIHTSLTSDQRSMRKRFPEVADEVHLLIDSKFIGTPISISKHEY